MDTFIGLSRRFLAMVPLKSLTLEDLVGDLKDLSWEQQSALLEATALHPSCVKYPPSRQYRSSFLKLLISQTACYHDHVLQIFQLEKSGVEINDCLYETFGELLGQKDPSEGWCYKTYTLPNGDHISIIESEQLISRGTTGLQTWQAAQFLAEWALEHPNIFDKKRVLELGSGLGLTGLVINKTCSPETFIFSDCHPNVLELLMTNLNNNIFVRKDDSASELTSNFESQGDFWKPDDNFWEKTHAIPGLAARWQHKMAPDMQVASLDWERLLRKDADSLLGDVDIVIAADVVYDVRIVPALVRILHIVLCQKHRPVAFIASTLRDVTKRDYFLKELDCCGIKHLELPGPANEVFFYDKSTPIQLLKLHLPDIDQSSLQKPDK